MGKYSFLVKPVFYILSLIFSCWMVFSIEKISPSDFGKYRSLFEKPSVQKKNSDDNDQTSFAKLKIIYSDYKKGLIDSTTFFRMLNSITDEKKQDNMNAKAMKREK